MSTSAHNVDDVDIDALREKYSRPGIREELAKSIPRATAEAREGGADGASRIRICDGCQATGYVQKEYNHRVIQECCRKCCGEGLLGTTQVTAQRAHEHERRQRIAELLAAVNSTTSVDELDLIEKELRALS